MKHTTTQPLENLVELADSGTWGDDGSPGTDSPVLRSTNIADNRLSLLEPAWRVIPTNDQVRRKLATGDIIVTKSSGSPDHIGKCAIFEDPADGKDYYFSNFMLRLRAKKGLADPRWLHYWLTSDSGRFILQQMNSTTTGLRNLSVGQYLQQRLPTPPLPEQRRIADILDKADAIRRKRQEAFRSSCTLIHGMFWSMFGEGILDSADGRTRPGWRSVAIDDIKADRPYSCIGGPFGSDLTAADYVSTPGVPVIRGGNLSDDSPYMNEDGLVFVSAKKAEDLVKCSAFRGDIIFSQRGARLAGQLGIIRDDSRFPQYIVSQSQMKLAVETSQVDPIFLVYYCQSRWAIREMERRTISTGVPHINLGILKAFPVHLPPRKQQELFRTSFQKHQSLYGSCRKALNQCDELFNSLVQRAFRGEL